jgi:hypothetical protein
MIQGKTLSFELFCKIQSKHSAHAILLLLDTDFKESRSVGIKEGMPEFSIAILSVSVAKVIKTLS